MDVAVQDRRGRRWMSVTSHAENRLPWRPVYQRYQGEYVNWINHDDDWTRWREGHRYRDLTITACLEPDADESQVANRAGKDLMLDLPLDGRFLLYRPTGGSTSTGHGRTCNGSLTWPSTGRRSQLNGSDRRSGYCSTSAGPRTIMG